MNPTGFLFYAVQMITLVLLALAANTSFGGLPVLASLLARDNFLPHVFALRADRRVFRYGVGVLAVAALFVVAPTAAQPATDRDYCINVDNVSAPDAVIAACTALTEAYARGEIEPSDAAAAYVGRGNAYAAIRERSLATADYDRAIAIYDRAIGLFGHFPRLYRELYSA